MTLRHAALALALASAAATAQAGVKASAVRPGNWVVLSRDEVLVPLNAAGATTLSFNPGLSRQESPHVLGRMCRQRGRPAKFGDGSTSTSCVNGVVVTPTAGSADPFLFCEWHRRFDSYIRASITIPIQGKAGTNTVQIKARGASSVTGMWLGDSALVIYD